MNNNLNYYKLTTQQELIYNTMRYTNEDTSANITVLYLYNGKCNIELLSKSIKNLLECNEVLNCSLISNNDFLGINVDDLSQNEPEIINFENRNLVDDYAKRIAKEELLLNPLCKIRGVNIDNRQFGILLNINHIIFDAWSAKVIEECFYNLYFNNKINKSDYKYTDYIEVEKTYLNSKGATRDKKYWLDTFEKNQSPVFLSEKDSENFRAEREKFVLSYNTIKEISEFCKDNQVSLMTLYSCAYSVYMTKFKNVDSSYLGFVCHNRSVDFKNTVGMFVNTVPALVEIDKSASFIDCIMSSKMSMLSAMRHQKYNYSKILTNIREEYRYSGKLYDTTISYQNVGVKDTINADITWYNNSFQTESLMIHIGEDFLTGNITISYDYQTEKFDREDIQRFHDRIMHIIMAGIKDTNTIIENMDIIDEKEKKTVVYDFNQEKAFFPRNESIISLFEMQVLKTPYNIAIKDYTEKSMSYSELDVYSGKLAYTMKENGVKAGDKVALFINRGVNQIIAILATLKVGAAYVPIDINYPNERKKFILKDSEPSIILTDDLSIISYYEEEIKCLNINDNDVFDKENTYVFRKINPNDVAYIIFTSGTTGKPKGVMISHKNVVRLLKNDKFQFDFSHNDVWMQFHSYCFDFSVWEIFGALTNGAKLILPSETQVKNSYEVLDIIYQEKLTILNQVPSSFYNLMAVDDEQKMRSVRYIIFGGEALLPAKLRVWHDTYSDAMIINMYGITETTVHVTYKEITDIEIQNGISNIGKPIPTLQVYLLNKNTICGINMIGEICVTGEGVSLGYINNQKLTDERFVDNPFGDGKMYRSGDLAEWLPDGNLRYVGRMDHQIQFHGFRIELGEIESAIRKIPNVTDSVAICKENGSEDAQIYSYFCATREISQDQVRTELESLLPSYMMPSLIMQLDKFPITANGKLDKKALPDIKVSSSVEYVAPSKDKEKIFTQILERVLDVEKVGMDDNYIELGGDSIKAIKIVSLLREKKLDVKVWNLTNLKTVRLICDAITEMKEDQKVAISNLKSARLSPIQKYFINKQYSNPNYYLQSFLLKYEEVITKSVLETIIRLLISKHPMLHAKFKDDYQYANNDFSWSYIINEYDFIQEKIEDIPQLIKQHSIEIKNKINFKNQTLIGLGVFHTLDGHYVLISIHHMVIDGVSWRILLNDFNEILNKIKRNEKVIYFNFDSPYLSWSETLYQNRDTFRKEIPYWKDICKHCKPKLEIESDFVVRPVYIRKHLTFDQNVTTALLKDCHKAFNTQINDIIGAAIARTFGSIFNKDIVVAEFESHGRTMVDGFDDIVNTIGWFTSIYPVKLTSTGDYENDIIAAKEAMSSVPNNGTGFMVLKEYCGVDFNNVVPNIRVNYLGDFNELLNDFNVVIDDRYLSRDIDRGNNYENDITIDCFCINNKFHAKIVINPIKYTGSQIDAMPFELEKNIRDLVDFCTKYENKYLTPSDFDNAKINYNQLKPITISYGNNIESIGKLTPMQEGMVYYYLNDQHDGTYIIQNVIDFKNGINVFAAKKAFSLLINYYDILRTAFWCKDELMRRVVVNKPDIKFINELSFENLDSFNKWLDEDKIKGFDIDNPPLIRLSIVKISNSYKIVWTFHHLIFDGWSFGLFLTNFLSLYTHINNDKFESDSNLLSEFPKMKFDEYVDKLDETITSDYDRFWINMLSEYEGSSMMRPFNQVYQAEEVVKSTKFTFDNKLKTEICDFCKKSFITLNTLFETVLGILIQRYNNSNDIVFGKVVSGRNIEVDNINTAIGMFVNTIPCRVTTNENDTCISLLNKVQENALKSNKYELYPLTRLNKETGLGSNLIQILLVFENYSIDKNTEKLLEQNNAKVEFTREQTNYDLTISIFPGEELSVQFMYNLKYYKLDDVQYIFNHLTTLFSNIIKNSNDKISNLSIMDEAEEDVVKLLFNDTSIEYPSEQTVVSLFKREVKTHPDKTAVIFQDKKLSYLELDQLSDKLAVNINNLGYSSKNKIIPFVLNRDENIYIAMLGILKSGNGYLPIDPSLPIERIDFMIRDSESECVIYSNKCEELISELYIEKICIEETVGRSRAFLRPIEISSSNNCYIIYTSGSTGEPKGVIITHKNAVNFCYNNLQIMYSIKKSLNPVMLSTTTISFDIFVTESLLQLLNGSTILLASKEQQNEQHALAEYAIANKATSIQTTPSKMRALIYDKTCCEYLKQMTTIILGGEVFPEELFVDLRKYTDADIYNIYGPSESTVWITTKLVENLDTTIGRPFSNTQIYILNNNKLCSIGEPGELCVAGDCVGIGYLNKPKLNKEKFIDNPFGKGLMYRTGDLASWRADGCINYMGRIDKQVKIHGQRIELGEIESQIRSIDEIKNVAVIVNSNSALCCYYESDIEISCAIIEQMLNRKLPKYMVPHNYMKLEKLPINNNGKLNKKLLPEIKEEKVQEYVVPKNDLEKKISDIFCKVLNVENVSIDDSFFAIGGDSIKSIQLVSLLYEYNIHLKDIEKFPTVRKLAENITLSNREIPQEALSGETILLPTQKRLVEISDRNSISNFNQSILLKVNDEMDKDLIKETLIRLIKHHDALRLSYSYGSNVSKFVDAENIMPKVFEINCSLFNFEQKCNIVQNSISLEKGELISAAYIKTNFNKKYLLIVLHHWCCDGISQRIILEDFINVYESLKIHKEPELPNKTDSIRSWAEALDNYYDKDKINAVRNFWDSRINNDDLRRYDPELLSELNQIVFAFSSNISHQLSEKTSGVLEMLLLAFSYALKSKDDCFATLFLESHGRETDIPMLNIARTIGWFTSMYPIKINVCDDDINLEMAEEIKNEIKSIPESGVSYSFINKHMVAAPLFNYMGSFEEQEDTDYRRVLFGVGKEVSDNIRSTNPMVVNIFNVNKRFTVDIRYSPYYYPKKTINKIVQNFKKHLKYLLNLEKKENLTNQIIDGFKNYSSTKDEIVTVINKEAKKHIFMFPPAMLKVAYIPLFEKMSTIMSEYCFHVFHLTQNDGMAKMFGEYIRNQANLDESPVLMGYSGGGNIAYDTSDYLNSKGIGVSKIVMIDGFKWDEGIKYVTISDDSINEMIENFTKETNLDANFFNSDAVQKLINNERKGLIEEARIYQEYCDKHRDQTKVIPNCEFVNLLSEDVLPDENDTREGWNKVSDKKVKYVQGKGTHITMLSDPNNLRYNVNLLLNELGGNDIE